MTLRSCGYCGGEAELCGRFIGKKFYVWCKNCHIRTPYSAIKDYAVALWNNRTNDALLREIRDTFNKSTYEFEMHEAMQNRLLLKINKVLEE